MNTAPATLDAAQDAYQAWLRARALAIDAARAFVARGDAESRQELEGFLATESRQRAEFERVVEGLEPLRAA